MGINSFKQDIDELIGEFAQDELTTLADMKRVWLSKKFSYIYQACPATNLAFFMQTLYGHCIGYMIGTGSLSQRLGGLYCLYCLNEIQPFKPPFKIYLSFGELKKLRVLVADAKAHDIQVVPALVKRMLQRNTFLFGAVDLTESCATETVKQLQELQSARIQVAHEKIFGNAPIDNYIHMDFDMAVDLNSLKKMSSEYVKLKDAAIEGISNFSDVQDLKRISENSKLISDEMEIVASDWDVHRQTFCEEREFSEDDGYGDELEQLLLEQCQDEDSTETSDW